MAKFAFLSIHPTERPAGVDITPELADKITRRYRAWTDQMQALGRLIEMNKLYDATGRVVRGLGPEQIVTDGPFSEAKEVIGGYWIIEAADYDEAVRLGSDCPTVEFWGTLVIREVELFER